MNILAENDGAIQQRQMDIARLNNFLKNKII